jgi:E3 ubiquitin-protein ligase MARCH6
MNYHIVLYINSFESQLHHTSGLIMKPLNSIWSGSSDITASTVSGSVSLSWLDSLPDYLGPFEPYFVWIGSEVRETVTSAQATWTRLAVGSGPTNRVFAILLGYDVILFAFCVYLNVLTVGNAKTAGSAVRNVVKQQLLVIKVCLGASAYQLINLFTRICLGCYFHFYRTSNLSSRLRYCS